MRIGPEQRRAVTRRSGGWPHTSASSFLSNWSCFINRKCSMSNHVPIARRQTAALSKAPPIPSQKPVTSGSAAGRIRGVVSNVYTPIWKCVQLGRIPELYGWLASCKHVQGEGKSCPFVRLSQLLCRINASIKGVGMSRLKFHTSSSYTGWTYLVGSTRTSHFAPSHG